MTKHKRATLPSNKRRLPDRSLTCKDEIDIEGQSERYFQVKPTYRRIGTNEHE